MINDNKQAQRGSPLQRGPLLDPVQANPNQPYTPVPGAGQGTVYQPGRTIFGRDYATPEENPLATLLGEIPQTVRAISATVETVKEMEKRRDSEALLEALGAAKASESEAQSRFPNQEIPLDERRNLNNQAILRLKKILDTTENTEVRLQVLSQLQEFETRRNVFNEADRRLSLADEEKNLEETARTTAVDRAALPSYVVQSGNFIRSLEEERNRQATAGGDVATIDQRILSQKNRDIQVFTGVAVAEISRIDRRYGIATPEGKEEVDKYLDSFDEYLESSGVGPEEIQLTMISLTDEITRRALVNQQSKREQYISNLERSVSSLFEPDADGSSLMSRAVNGLSSNQLQDLNNVQGRTATVLFLVDQALQTQNIAISEDVFLEQGFSQVEARRANDSIMLSLRDRAGQILNTRSEEIRQERVTSITGTLEESYLGLQTFPQIRNLDRIVSLELERNRLYEGTNQHKPDAEVIQNIRQRLVNSLTLNPTFMLDVQRGGIRGQEISARLLQVLGIEPRGPGDPAPPSLSINSTAATKLSRSENAYIRPGSIAFHIYELSKRNNLVGDSTEAADQSITSFVQLVSQQVLIAAAQQQATLDRNSATILGGRGGVTIGNIEKVSDMSVEDLISGVITASHRIGNTEAIPSEFRRSTTEESIAAYREHARTNQALIPVDGTFGPMLALFHGAMSSGTYSGGSIIKNIPAGFERSLGLPQKVAGVLQREFTSNLETFINSEYKALQGIALSRLRIIVDGARSALTGLAPESIDRVDTAMSGSQDPAMKRLWTVLKPLITVENTGSSAIFDTPETARRYFEATELVLGADKNMEAAQEAEVRRRFSVMFPDSDYTFDAFRGEIGKDFNVREALTTVILANRFNIKKSKDLVNAYKSISKVFDTNKKEFDGSLAAVTVALNPTVATIGEAYAHQLMTKFDISFAKGELTVVPPTAQLVNGKPVDMDFASNPTVKDFREQIAGGFFSNWYIGLDTAPKNFVERHNLENLHTIDQFGLAVNFSPSSSARSGEDYRRGLEKTFSVGLNYMLSRITAETNIDSEQVYALQFRANRLIGSALERLSGTNSLNDTREEVLSGLRTLLQDEFNIEIPPYVTYNPENPAAGSQLLPPPVNELTREMRKNGIIPLNMAINISDAGAESSVNHPYFGGFYGAPNINMNLDDLPFPSIIEIPRMQVETRFAEDGLTPYYPSYY